MLNQAIGGYFQLELPASKGFLYPQALKYQSARAAFYALLLYIEPKRIWVPYYICDSMLAPLYKSNIEVRFYSLNRDFSIKDKIILGENDFLLYVNYFSVCGKVQDDILSKFNKQQVIFDHSQAFFARPKNCLATIYSPRKFFGVPDGGLLVTSLAMAEPEEVDVASIIRASHLLKRLAGDAEDGYLDFQDNENSLNDFKPKKMSQLTWKILQSIDYEKVEKTRVDNFVFLHSKLAASNLFKIDLGLQGQVSGPMGYPYLTDDTDLKSKLVKNRIFIPTYWPEVLERKGVGQVERMLVSALNLIPCDQRYSTEELLSVTELLGH